MSKSICFVALTFGVLRFAGVNSAACCRPAARRAVFFNCDLADLGTRTSPLDGVNQIFRARQRNLAAACLCLVFPDHRERVWTGLRKLIPRPRTPRLRSGGASELSALERWMKFSSRA